MTRLQQHRFEEIGQTERKKVCRKVEEIEPEYCEKDGILEEGIERIVIEDNGMESSGEDNEWKMKTTCQQQMLRVWRYSASEMELECQRKWKEEMILRDMLLEPNDSCEQYGMKINANKAKAIVIGRKIKQCAVSSTQKFLVQQHITTSKHQANKQLNSKQRQLFLTQPTTSNVRSEFNIDLCRSLISADIPLYKLKNKVFREFLEKYTQHTIPDESTLRKTYAPSIYDETIQKIRDEIKDSSIWVSIDETPDKEGRLVGNVVIGLLSEQYSERILLHCDVLEKCNNKTIVKLFNEAMGILWPKGIMYDNVLFFISDAAPYMVKAGQALSVVYPKLTHFTCVAHAFHRVAEVVRDNFPKVDLLISSVKKYFSKLPVELTC
ncbi:hypothetical protein ANN_04665 [Periplaneta americana]|uniref:DUF659 domain-containing protein n=1 Tax=Periplaneta americana TaxID=6978 RepID=A0ABQ8TAZ9_PERAM|nr:hypothetical protein ANN_04665 [Periplaneta americana]